MKGWRVSLGGLLALCLLANSLRAEPEHPAFPPASPELSVPPSRAERAVGLHPEVVLRDRAGEPVVTSGQFVSYLSSCGTCHDAEWIGQHGYHFRMGIDELLPLGKAPSGRAWDFGTGLYGRWDPLAGYASVASRHAAGSEIDRWITQNRARLLGGGPALAGEASRDYLPNCAMCHVRGAAVDPERDLPFAAYQTAVLEPLGLVAVGVDAAGNAKPEWNVEAFSQGGAPMPSKFTIQAPSNEACGACHGIAKGHQPRLQDWKPQSRLTVTTGQLFLPTRISDSSLNILGRDRLSRPWDVHAERLLTCRDCHFSPNDPSAALRRGHAQPDHLRREVRNVSLGEFLRRPSHELAKGHSTQGTIANELDGTMRRCEDCHDAPRVHGWLPKSARHLEQIACETCHVDLVRTPARRVTDYSVVDAGGQPRVEERGIVGDRSDEAASLVGYQPLLLRRNDADGKSKLFPFNVISSFFWVVESPQGPRPIELTLLRRALYEAPGASAKLLALLDRNHDGRIAEDERALTDGASVDGVRELLVAAGAKSPRLVGEMQPYGIHHGMVPARFALRRCDACHGPSSRLTAAFELARLAPYGVTPKLIGDANVVAAFTIDRRSEGQLTLRPDLQAAHVHVFGVSRNRWVDGLGIGAVGLVLTGAISHAILRALAARRRRRASA